VVCFEESRVWYTRLGCLSGFPEAPGYDVLCMVSSTKSPSRTTRIYNSRLRVRIHTVVRRRATHPQPRHESVLIFPTIRTSLNPKLYSQHVACFRRMLHDMMLAQDTDKRHHRIRDKPSEVCVGPVLLPGAQFAEEGVTGPCWRIGGSGGVAVESDARVGVSQTDCCLSSVV
jgi:hypothetical protein